MVEPHGHLVHRVCRRPKDLRKYKAGRRWSQHSFAQYAVLYLLDHAEAAGIFRHILKPWEKVRLKQIYRRWLAVAQDVILAHDKTDIVRAADRTYCTKLLGRFNSRLLEAGILVDESELEQELYCHANLHWVYLETLKDSQHLPEIQWQYQRFQNFEENIEQLLELESNDEHRRFLTHSSIHNSVSGAPRFNLLGLACFLQGLKRTTSDPFLTIIRDPPALFWAVKLNRPDMIRHLLISGFALNETDDEGRTPLSLSIELGHSECSSILSSQGGLPSRGLATDGHVFSQSSHELDEDDPVSSLTKTASL